MRIWVAAFVAALALPAAGSAVAQDGNFCPLLKRAMDAKAKGFAPLKTTPFHGETKEWDARVKLPGLQSCRVDLNAKLYNCWNTGLSRPWLLDNAEQLKLQIVACIGQPAAPEKTDESAETTRTVIGWNAENDVRVDLIRRIGKQKTPKNSVFIYVR